MKRFNLLACLCMGVLILSGCNQANQSASAPVSQKPISQKTAPQKRANVPETSVYVYNVEPTAIAVTEAAPSAKTKLGASKVATKKPKVGKAFDLKQFHLARTLELPYYSDSIGKFAFSPDGKTVAGVGYGLGKINGITNLCSIVFLFDATTGVLLKRLVASNRDEGFNSFVWSPDGNSMAAWYSQPVGRFKTLCVWNVKSGQVTARFSTLKWAVSNAAWMNSSSLLVARSYSADGLTSYGQLMICNGRTGRVNNVYDLGEQSVASIRVPKRGAPQLLILQTVGEKKIYRERDVQSSIRTFRAGALGPRLIQFKAGEAFFTAAFAQDGRVALSGVQQGATAAIYAVGDLKAGKIVWQNTQVKRQRFYVSSDIALSPNEQQFRARTSQIYPDLIFDMANGKSLPAPTKLSPFFAHDGKRFVRLLNSVKRTPSGQYVPDGQKPHLKIAEIWER